MVLALVTTLPVVTKSSLEPVALTSNPPSQYLPVKLKFVLVVAFRMPMRISWPPGKTAKNTFPVAETKRSLLVA